ncbi:hypothetical protein HY483_01850 [Candidatus Woesearchaeota archaeon]|nr:hypothetical protein [Candidatus Woesearchaeota archaeon]
MGRDRDNYMMVLHSSTHPLLALVSGSEGHSKESLEGFAEKSKLYREIIQKGNVFVSQATINASEEFEESLRGLRGIVKHDWSLKEPYDALRSAQRELTRTLEQAVSDRDVGPTTARIHKEVCRELGMGEGIIRYDDGTELSKVLTIAIYHAEVEGTMVRLPLLESDAAKARKIMQSRGLQRLVEIRTPESVYAQD